MVMRSVLGSRVGRLVPCAAMALLVLTSSDPAQARYRRFFYVHHAAYHQRVHVAHAARSGGASAAEPGNFAAMVVDANSGRTLYAVNEDAPRHPASITKVMTLYLLFEELDKGAMRLDTPLTVSSHAAAQSPTKLGLRPGSTITVENAIKAIVTKSANDMAVAVAESIAGDEPTFAAAMTRKARALGMNHTDYVNASGLPDMRQITTARDLTILGRAIRERFPRYYRYFSTTSFTYAGSFMPNHNHLLGRVDGMDGIKTGYTNASGFNLLTSVNRDGRHIVSVVLGGRTAASRDRVMQSLIEGHIEEASATPSTRIAEASPIEEPAESPAREASPPPVDRQPPRRPAELAREDDGDVAAPEPIPARVSFAATDDAPEPPVERHPPSGPNLIAPDLALPAPSVAMRQAQARHQAEAMHEAEAQREAEKARAADAARVAEAPRPVARPAPIKTAALKPPADRVRPAFIAGAPKALESNNLSGPSRPAERRLALDGSTRRPPANGTPSAAVATATPSSLHWVTGAQPARLGPSGPALRQGAKAQAETEPSVTGSIDRAPTHEESRIAKAEPLAEPDAPPRGGWVIQIGATDDAEKANALLSRAKTEGHSALASAKPFTEKVQKGDSTLYRARFAGLDPNEAEAACRTLKRSGFACFATHN